MRRESNAQVFLVNEETRTLVIEVYEGGDWRLSRTMPKNTSVDHARTTLERHQQFWPKSGPYRLVEYVETHTKTMEVL